MVAAHPSGFAAIPIDKVREEGRLELEPWAAINGRVAWGDTLGAEVAVTLVASTRRRSPKLISDRREAISDGAGRFNFDRVPPGLVQINHRGGLACKLTTIAGGDPAEVVLGGRGRSVVGRLVGADRFDDLSITCAMDTNPPEEAVGYFSPWTDLPDFQQSSVGRHYYRQRVRIDAQGSFRLEDVLPGAYRLFVKRSTGRSWRIAGHREFAIEEPATGIDEGPLDLGEIRIRGAP